MSMTVEPMDATIGAVVRGIALADLDDVGFARVAELFWDRAVLVFPEQRLELPQQIEFARRFGPLERMNLVNDSPVTKLTNVDADGSPIAEGSSAARFLEANQYWHTDSSFKPVGALASVLSARVVPTSGGDTEWADMRDAYDSLDADTRRELDGLEAVHDLVVSQGRAGALDHLSEDARRSLSAVVHPLLAVHPVTGRTSLYVGRHAYEVVGREGPDGEQLLARLMEHITQPPRLMSHRWQAGDVVMWDNRSVLHRGRPWPAAEPRTMYRIIVAGPERPNPWALAA